MNIINISYTDSHNVFWLHYGLSEKFQSYALLTLKRFTTLCAGSTFFKNYAELFKNRILIALCSF